MKIAFFEVKLEEKEFFQKHLKGLDLELFFFSHSLSEKDKGDFDVLSIFIHSKITVSVLDNFPNLKYIQTRSTGYDHIDLVECYRRGIFVSNVRGYAGPAVGEFAFGLLLEALRKIFVAINRLKVGSTDYMDLKGREIKGKTIGILGLGHIGKSIAKIAKGFGANVVGFVRDVSKCKDVECYGNLEEVLKKSDILFIALPLTPKTKNLINKSNIDKFKGDIIINPARAEIIEEDVYEDFKGIIAADVLPNWELAKKDNIIATPHMAYYTKEALDRILRISLDNLNDFLNHNKPRFCLQEVCKIEYNFKDEK